MHILEKRRESYILYGFALSKYGSLSTPIIVFQIHGDNSSRTDKPQRPHGNEPTLDDTLYEESILDILYHGTESKNRAMAAHHKKQLLKKGDRHMYKRNRQKMINLYRVLVVCGLLFLYRVVCMVSP
jgi:hypothetical protein